MSNKSYNLNVQMKNLKGEEVGGATLGEVLADLLAQKSEGISPSKAISMAVKLADGKPLELDQSDLDALRRFVEAHEGLYNIAKVRILELLQ